MQTVLSAQAYLLFYVKNEKTKQQVSKQTFLCKLLNQIHLVAIWFLSFFSLDQCTRKQLQFKSRQSKLTFTRSKLTMEPPDECVKSVQN